MWIRGKWAPWLSLKTVLACLATDQCHTYVQSTLKIYEGETHTSPLVENPMRGGTDKLVDDILSMVKGEETITVQYSLCPGFLVTLAAWVCPF